MTLLGFLTTALLAGAPPAPATLPADSTRVVGRVIDASTGHGIPGVRVSLTLPAVRGEAGTVWAGVTDGTGSFATGRVPAVAVLLRAEGLGYLPASSPLALESGVPVEVLVDLSPDPLELAPLAVVAERESRLATVGFYDRRRAGLGYSLTREEIVAAGAARPSDLFRRIPGVQMEAQRRGTASLLRYRGCYPDLLVDGVPLVGPVPVDHVLSVEQIEAVEVHSGAHAPAQARVGACGTVMVWTREGSRAEPGQGMTRGRLLTGAAFVLVAFLLTR